MVIIQITLTDDKSQFEIRYDVLSREDATMREQEFARALEQLLLTVTESGAKDAGIDLHVVEIPAAQLPLQPI